MSRITTPASIEASPLVSRLFLTGVKKQLGAVPNMFRLIGNSPASLEGFIGLFEGLSKGTLSTAMREGIALAVAQINACDYCLSAHTYLGKNIAKLDDTEITANRNGASNDPQMDVALKFAAKIAHNRGHVSTAELDAVRAAGYSDAQVIEIVLHVALNTLTNYINEVGGTEIDFPVVTANVA